jgi:hypothetical protein
MSMLLERPPGDRMPKPLPVTVFAVALALGVTGCSAATGHASTGGPVRIGCTEPQSGGTLPTHRLAFAGLGLDAWTGSPRSPVSPSIAYDWDHHSYGDVPHPMISPQPGASLVAYVDGFRSSFPNLLRLTHVDGSGARSITLPAAAVAAPQWSPDAKRLLVSLSDSTGRTGFAVVDPANGTVTAQWPGMKLRAPFFSWYGDGTKVAATVADGSAIQLYDLDGSAGESGRITRKWVVLVPGDDQRPPALVLSRDS